MDRGQGAGTARAGPFPLPEPLGLLHGSDAAAAVAAGIARSLAGGSAAFTLLRVRGEVLPVAEASSEDLLALTASVPDWAGLGAGPAIMGILNVTPDSFSDGGDLIEPEAAIAAGHRMLAEGANVLDVGGESTRPGAPTVPPEQEQARVIPVIAALARAGAVVSIDTRNAATMERALDAGATIVNDVSALAHDPAAPGLVARAACPVVLMHMRGSPATMLSLSRYTDVAAEVVAELAVRVAAAEAAGIARHRIAVDPGFGFAKTAEHSVELLRRLPALAALGLPIVAGISRKSSIGMLTGETEAKRRGPGSVAAAVLAAARGARVLRVHDVAETRQALRVWAAC